MVAAGASGTNTGRSDSLVDGEHDLGFPEQGGCVPVAEFRVRLGCDGRDGLSDPVEEFLGAVQRVHRQRRMLAAMVCWCTSALRMAACWSLEGPEPRKASTASVLSQCSKMLMRAGSIGSAERWKSIQPGAVACGGDDGEGVGQERAASVRGDGEVSGDDDHRLILSAVRGDTGNARRPGINHSQNCASTIPIG